MPTLTKIGRYEVIRELGHGSMGTVYLARDTALGRFVALKTFRGALHDDLEDSVALRRRVLREAQRAGTLSHPNIVTIYDVVENEEDAGTFFIVMEYVEGGGLDARLRSAGPLPLAEAASLVTHIAAALDHLHGRGIVHRDIKPANVLVSADNRVKLTDFGIARSEDPSATLETDILGTPHYMAPEQVQGRPIDGRTDVFGLGVLVYEMLTGTKPFLGKTVAEVAHNILYLPMVEPAIGDRPLAAPLQDLLARALEKDPGERFQTAGNFARALARIAEGHSELDAAETAAMPRGRWLAMLGGHASARARARRPWRVLTAVVPIALLLGGGLAYLSWQSQVDTAMFAQDEHVRQIGYLKLMTEGRRLLKDGDAQAAEVLFEAATSLAGDPERALQARDDARRAVEDAEAEATEEELAAARDRLGSGAERAEARRVLSEVERSLRGPNARAAPESPLPAPTPDLDPLRPATLVVELSSESPQGEVLVWVNNSKVLERSFAFFDRRFLIFRRPAVPGAWTSQVELQPIGAAPVQVLVARADEAATVLTLETSLTGGATRTLAIHVPASGDPTAVLR
jgi:tRNA A-37 threonylcarbamoyl transferase component Bud32